MTIILFLIIFAIVVISHELGHFLIAKANGIRVLEFAFGMGPTILHFEKNGTKYSWKLLPVGGFCAFDNPEEEKEDNDPGEKPDFSKVAEKAEKLMTGDLEKQKEKATGIPLLEASAWARLATFFAGPFFNLVLGFLVAMIVVTMNGTDLPVIQQVMDNSAASEAGIMAGDVIKKINGENIHVYREVSLASMLNRAGKSMVITIERDGSKKDIILTPKYSEEDERYYIGFLGSGSYVKCTGIEIPVYAFYETQFIVKNTIKSLGLLLSGNVKSTDVSGPVGLANTVGETYNQVKDYGFSIVFLMTLDYILMLSVNLGIMNLLPIPALDGGRIIFVLLEIVRGKPIPPEKEGMVHLAGFALLFGLMFLVMYNDIMNIFIR